MAAQDLLPKLEARFSEINLSFPKQVPKDPSLTPRSRKTYPHHLYPSKTPTLGHLPLLLTAARAENRVLLLKVALDPKVLVRTTKKHPLPASTLQKRYLSAPLDGHMGAQRPECQFSFMRETSASLKKHAGSPTPPARLRNDHLFMPPVKPKKRQLLGPLPITKPRRTASGVSRVAANSTDIPRHPGTVSGDPDSPKTRSRSPTLHVSHPYASRARLDPQKRRQGTRKSDKKTTSPSLTSPSQVGDEKVQTTVELYRILYQNDHELFGNDDSCQFTAEQPLLAQEALSGAENGPEGGSLGIYERGELLRKQAVYYVPKRSMEDRNINIRSYSDNYGFDDPNGNYQVVTNDHINYRYEIQRVLGNGSFGNVVLCKDHKYRDGDRNKHVAIKIIKNDLNWSLQAVYEIKMLKHLNEAPADAHGSEYGREYGNRSPVLTYFDHFHFRGHMCIVTDVLSLNLYSMLEITRFKGLSIDLIRSFSRKILEGLSFVHSKGIIHCDVKPENIMVKLPSHFDPVDPDAVDFGVKLIDFGLSCFDHEISYSYIQSRFYRAPEVIIGARYNNKIDLWLFGCVVAELFTGSPLFPGRNELEQVGLIAEVFGAPSSALVVVHRKRLMKQARQQAALNVMNSANIQTGPSKPPVVDEKTIKRTLLYTLFDMDGKMNLQFLNMRLQAAQNASAPGANLFKRNFKLNSKTLEVILRVNTSTEEKRTIQHLLRFLQAVFQWDPAERSSAQELLNDAFLQ